MTVWLEIIAFHPLPVVGTTPWLCSPRFHSIMHPPLSPSRLPAWSIYANPAGTSLVIIFPRVAWSLVGFSYTRKTAVISRFCNDRDSGKGHRESFHDRLRLFVRWISSPYRTTHWRLRITNWEI